MAEPEFWGALARGMLQRLHLLREAADGNLGAFKRIASKLDGGKGRIREVVEAATDDDGAGALHVAAMHGRTRMCAYLVDELHMDVNAAASQSGKTPLSYAVRSSNNVDAVRYLLDHGADPNKPVGEGCTALHIAAGGGICEMVELLLSKGADVNSLSNLGTPLHVAAMEGQGDVVKILLDYNADYNNEFAFVTPLFNALKAPSLSCVKHLIKAGADVTKGVDEFTPLILAVHDGLTDFYECLLEAGADPNAPDEFGHLPIEIAAYYNRRKDVEILLRVTARIPSVHDWSVDGVLAYAKSIIPTDQDDPVYKMNLADLKFEGNKAYKRKDYYTAIKLYTVAIMNPDSAGDATWYSNRCMCYINLGDGEKALRDAEACWNMDPQWPKACFRKGAAYMLLKDYGKARDAFLDGLKLDPTNAEMDDALKECLDALKMSRATTKLSELSLAQKQD